MGPINWKLVQMRTNIHIAHLQGNQCPTNQQYNQY